VVSVKVKQYHRAQAAAAQQLYVASLTPLTRAADWRLALREARDAIAETVRATKAFSAIAGALQQSGKYTLVLRHLLAPPISQDQFKFLAPKWVKTREKDAKPLKPSAALEVETVFDAWRDRQLTRWLQRKRAPNQLELRNLLSAIAPLMADQMVSTVQRNRMAAIQERSVINYLSANSWQLVPSRLITQSASLNRKEFMHKTRFATLTQPQEVDIACGLRGTIVMAMECKASNDQTNSIKRVNDVLKKADAWQKHWGSFMEPVAMLQGVIALKDVMRLEAHNVRAFWSHDLPTFGAWLAKKL
jgi:hypothetical protein